MEMVLEIKNSKTEDVFLCSKRPRLLKWFTFIPICLYSA